MITSFDQKIHKTMMPTQQSERQSGGISGNGDDRFCDVDGPKRWMGQRICSPEQRSFEHEFALPPDLWNEFVGHGFVAPDEGMPFGYHSSEEILVLSGSKIRPERLCTRFDD